jgi:hypothetical protein
VLFLRTGESVEVINNLIRFRTAAGMRLDGLQQIGGAAVMEEDPPLPQAQRRCAEFVGAGALHDIVGETTPM